jgi:1,4-alpha-glucan branching enzyme
VLSKNETISLGEVELLVAGQHHDPHAVLGAHTVPGANSVVIRALRPLATSVTAVLPDGSRHPMTHSHLGVFEVTVPEEAAVLPNTGVRDYRLEVAYGNGDPQLQDDPYRYLPTLGELDLYLIGEGRHEQLWDALGARPIRVGEGEGEDGTAFAVWAPNARGVRLVGDFNFWDGRAHPMRSLGGAGVWELFVPGIGPGTRYKFSICGPDGAWREKADPDRKSTRLNSSHDDLHPVSRMPSSA